jgi:hypothetical protein
MWSLLAELDFFFFAGLNSLRAALGCVLHQAHRPIVGIHILLQNHLGTSILPFRCRRAAASDAGRRPAPVSGRILHVASATSLATAESKLLRRHHDQAPLLPLFSASWHHERLGRIFIRLE